ncbi:MAG: DCC1-like thiol-disulfide oxidoreductase family protein [Petrimonas sp.]|nr:DCC1-like thiol-disulfide oxidoreductase family protein [Petrimonas sp.]
MKIILFDGVCNFCNGIVNFILKHDNDNLFLFSAQQSEEGQKILSSVEKQGHNLNSLIFIDENEVFEGADAAISISKYLKGVPGAFYILRFLPRKVNHAAYNFIAKHRYKIFGKRDSCRIPTEEEKNKFL